MSQVNAPAGARTWFPARVWSVTAYTADGKPLWSSQEDTFGDASYRRGLLRRILERDYSSAAERDELKQKLEDAMREENEE